MAGDERLMVELTPTEMEDLIVSIDGRTNVIETGSWILSSTDVANRSKMDQDRMWYRDKVRVNPLDIDQLEQVVRLKKLKLKLLKHINVTSKIKQGQ